MIKSLLIIFLMTLSMGGISQNDRSSKVIGYELNTKYTDAFKSIKDSVLEKSALSNVDMAYLNFIVPDDSSLVVNILPYTKSYIDPCTNQEYSAFELDDLLFVIRGNKDNVPNDFLGKESTFTFRTCECGNIECPMAHIHSRRFAIKLIIID